jgi:hypothetical protein
VVVRVDIDGGKGEEFILNPSAVDVHRNDVYVTELNK